MADAAERIRQSGIAHYRAHGFEPGIVEAGRVATAVTQAADGPRQNLFAARVYILLDGHEPIALARVVGNDAVRRGRESMQHGSLLQIPRLRFRQAFKTSGSHLDDAYSGLVSSDGRAISTSRHR